MDKRLLQRFANPKQFTDELLSMKANALSGMIHREQDYEKLPALNQLLRGILDEQTSRTFQRLRGKSL